MINVIKLGDTTIGECENCGCRFAYGEESIQSRPHKTPDGCARQVLQKLPKLFEYYVLCPQCGKDLTVISIKMQRA